jgi:hypothetical protein
MIFIFGAGHSCDLKTIARSYRTRRLQVRVLLSDFGWFLLSLTLLFAFFIYITVGCKEGIRPDLASHMWLLTSHPRERHMLLKWREVELANGGKLSWPNSVGQLSFSSAM